MSVLGIETSCDETAVAIVEEDSIVYEKVATQDIHRKYGGVVPEIASREHLKKINILLEECFSESGVSPDDLDAVSVTSGPGLEGSLLVGVMTARTLAYVFKKPLIEVDHIESHMFASKFTPLKEPPGIALVISGGHTRIVYIKEWGDYEILGDTRDDAIGECFDKVASIIGLSYPGGPAIEKEAGSGDPERFSFPVAKLGDSYDFSYSGIKTSVLYKVKYDLGSVVDDGMRKDIAASFQAAAFKPVIKNTIRAAMEKKAPWVFVCGGVAANRRLRESFAEQAPGTIEIVFPAKAHCTDNAAMVAACGQFYLNRKSDP